MGGKKPKLTRILHSGLLYYARSLVLLAAGVRTRRRLIELAIRRGPVVIEFREGTRLAVRSLLEAWVAKEAILDDLYGLAGLHAGWRVVDIGAAVGEFSVPAARRIAPGVLHAYEPAAASVAVMRRNLEMNAVENVRLHEEAVAAEAGRVTLRDDLCEAVLYHVDERPGSVGTMVSAVDLKQVLDRLPGGRCDFLKMDCEGAEFEILLGAGASVLERIDRMAVEYHDFAADHGELVRCLESCGRSVRIAPSPVYREIGYLYSEAAIASPPARGEAASEP
ncbi:MAG TPA: FkbM family methyltransferase [Planctomycetota bacterium]|nr:FkbM family methyltransferase [Planctomycetota bacterium]